MTLKYYNALNVVKDVNCTAACFITIYYIVDLTRLLNIRTTDYKLVILQLNQMNFAIFLGLLFVSLTYGYVIQYETDPVLINGYVYLLEFDVLHV